MELKTDLRTCRRSEDVVKRGELVDIALARDQVEPYAQFLCASVR